MYYRSLNLNLVAVPALYTHSVVKFNVRNYGFGHIRIIKCA